MSQTRSIGATTAVTAFDRSPRLLAPSPSGHGRAPATPAQGRDSARWHAVLVALFIAAVALFMLAVGPRLASMVNGTVGGERIFPVAQPGSSPTPLHR